MEKPNLNFVKLKKRAALLSISSNTFLIISKFIIGITTGSVSIISEAIHSLSDFLASILAFISVKISSEPADVDHQFGHGKFEDLSGGIEGIIIISAAIYIIYEAVEKIISKSAPQFNPMAGILVMTGSCIINIIVSTHIFKIACKTDSIALLSEAEHLKTDIYTSAGVLISLLLIKITGITFFDPLAAIIVAILIIRTGLRLCMEAGKNLLNTSLPEKERLAINNIIKKYMPKEVVEIYGLKTRKAGPERQIEFTLIVPECLTIKEGHNLCDRIEKNITEDIGNATVTIHLEPCDGNCENFILYQKNSSSCHNLKSTSR